MRKMGGGLLAVFFLLTWFGGALSQEESKPAQEEKKSENKDSEKKSAKKAVEVEGVISSVGQRTITFQLERKGKVREEVVGIDEKTKYRKLGATTRIDTDRLGLQPLSLNQRTARLSRF